MNTSCEFHYNDTRHSVRHRTGQELIMAKKWKKSAWELMLRCGDMLIGCICN